MDVLAVILDYKLAEPLECIAGARQQGGILFIGEAWGETEERYKAPFVGESGKELFRIIFEVWPEAFPELIAKCTEQMLGDGWIFYRDKWLEKMGMTLTNMVAFRPPRNDFARFCATKTEFGKEQKYPQWGPIEKGKYLKFEYFGELARLDKEIELLKPRLIICLGGKALWSITKQANISAMRGTVFSTPGHVRIKCLATYHPSGVMRNWSWRPIVQADLMKAKFESQFPEIRRPKRSIIVNPKLEDIRKFVDCTPLYWAVDIETIKGQIEMIGLAKSRSEAIVVPFVDRGKTERSYWRDQTEEICAWELVERALSSDVPKIFQNGLFDLQYLLPMGLKVKNAMEDSMLLSHSLYSEMQKGLGFLGSIFTNEPAWKLMRLKSETEENKRDE